MRIILFCATQRGLLILKKLVELVPKCELVVFSFREEAWEPPFMNAIQEFTVASGGQFHEARQVGAASWTGFWEKNDVDLMLAVSWRYMIPPEVYRRAKLGAFVFHDSLLPKYRGFSPTVWSIINGESQTGVSLFEITEEVDAGDIVAQLAVPISPEETISVILERVTQAYLKVLAKNLDGLLKGTAIRHAQNHTLATHTCRRFPNDNKINWSASTREIYNLIRATTSPYSGAFTELAGQKLIIWSAQPVSPCPEYCGRIAGPVVQVRNGIGTLVLTGDGALLITEVQRQNEEKVCATKILNRLDQTLGELEVKNLTP